ncbi:Shedu anti-phage system protein SduA domain-containing protein [Bradyrhizobium sp. USDA 4502]
MPMRPPTQKEKERKTKLVKNYMKLLNANGASEMSIKPFLDANPSFIPMPWMLNHQLHFKVVLPQLSVSSGLKTDYVYLTKSSTSWWCVLVEFESPRSRFFTNGNSIAIHSDLTRGLNQIDNWRAYLKKHKEAFLAELDPIRQPLNKNPVEFRYTLVMGRRSEFEHSIRKVERYSAYETGDRYKDVRVLTYDAVASEFEYSRISRRHTMKRSGSKFAFVKYNPDPYGEHLWSYMTREHLKLSATQIEKARRTGIKIDEWLDGRRLCNLGRDVAGARKKTISNTAKK